MSEPAWISALEWGLMCSLSFCLTDFFLADLLSEGSHETLAVMRAVAPTAASFLAVREIRNKKGGGRITFAGAFIGSMATSFVISVMFAAYTYWMWPPEMTAGETFVTLLLSDMLLACVSSIVLSVALRR